MTLTLALAPSLTLAPSLPKARASFDATIASTELATLESDAFSSGLLKQHRVSPDGMLHGVLTLTPNRDPSPYPVPYLYLYPYPYPYPYPYT